jgi:hypothetical protein
MPIGGNEGERRGFTGTSMEAFRWQVPRRPSARLTRSLKLATVVWLLRCSVLRETPMASAIHFKKQNCYYRFDSGCYRIFRNATTGDPAEP